MGAVDIPEVLVLAPGEGPHTNLGQVGQVQVLVMDCLHLCTLVHLECVEVTIHGTAMTRRKPVMKPTQAMRVPASTSSGVSGSVESGVLMNLVLLGPLYSNMY